VTVTTLAANTATVIQITVLLLSPVCGEFIPCSTEPCSVEPLIVPESLGVAGSVGLTGISSFFSKAAIASSIACAMASTSACCVIFLPLTTACIAASTPEKSLYSSLFKDSAFTIASSTLV